MSSVAIVTAWKNHPELAVDYFAAVETAKPDQLVVVDDCSDVPLEWAALRLDEPGGFCGANNAGLALVETEYVCFLNNDVAMLRPDWLQSILRLVEPGVVVAPIRYDPHGNVDGVAYPYADGWCATLLAEDARRVGGWDEAYDRAGPAYFSDCAFSFRARWEGMMLRDCQPGLHHKGGQTGGEDPVAFGVAMAANGQLFASQVREALKA